MSEYAETNLLHLYEQFQAAEQVAHIDFFLHRTRRALAGGGQRLYKDTLVALPKGGPI